MRWDLTGVPNDGFIFLSFWKENQFRCPVYKTLRSNTREAVLCRARKSIFTFFVCQRSVNWKLNTMLSRNKLRLCRRIIQLSLHFLFVQTEKNHVCHIQNWRFYVPRILLISIEIKLHWRDDTLLMSCTTVFAWKISLYNSGGIIL